jgi:broad specificity phosphatase PhoE
MEELILVRHAESEYSARGLLNGDPRVAVALSKKGREQARQLGARLAETEIDLCVTSEFARTIETADIALAGRDIPRLVATELNDHPAGEYEGLPLADYLAWARGAAPADLIPGTGDSRAAVVDRFARGFVLLLDRSEATILAVLHSLPIMYLLEAAVGRDPAARLGLLPYAEPRDLSRKQVAQAIARLERWLESPTWGS